MSARTARSSFTFSSEEKDDHLQKMPEQDGRQGPGMVKRMERFHVNSARSFLRKNVNLHLKDGSVIINVRLSEIKKDQYKKEKYVRYRPYGYKKTFSVPLKSIAWAELLNLNLILSG